MKILHLPSNIASMPAITVKALNDAGHEARGLFFGDSILLSSENMKVIPFKKKGITKFFAFLKWYFYFIKWVMWADVIHWCGSFSRPFLKVTLPVIKLLNKPALVEFVGSDIRNPEVDFADNPYYKEAFYNGYEYPYESAENSKATQKIFADAGFAVMVMPGMGQYVDNSIFKRSYLVFQRIETGRYESLPPNSENQRPTIVHGSTAPVGKGSKYIINAVENLRKKYNFEFKLLNNLPHAVALDLIKKSDIYVDQLISGSYGMASMEAMTFGKPVLTFMKASVLKEFQINTPFVNTNPENIEQNLEQLIKDGNLRNEIGEQSRKYVVKHHDVINVLPELIKVYQSEINIHL